MHESLTEFLYMGGYAAYVWSSYGIALAVIAGNIIWPWLAHRQVRKRIRNEEYDD